MDITEAAKLLTENQYTESQAKEIISKVTAEKGAEIARMRDAIRMHLDKHCHCPHPVHAEWLYIESGACERCVNRNLCAALASESDYAKALAGGEE